MRQKTNAICQNTAPFYGQLVEDGLFAKKYEMVRVRVRAYHIRVISSAIRR